MGPSLCDAGDGVRSQQRLATAGGDTQAQDRSLAQLIAAVGHAGGAAVALHGVRLGRLQAHGFGLLQKKHQRLERVVLVGFEGEGGHGLAEVV